MKTPHVHLELALTVSHILLTYATTRAPYKFVDELKKIVPALREEGIAVGVPPDTALVTLSKMAMERLEHPE